MAIKLALPEFQKAMNAHTHLTAPLSPMTAWRYGSGQFPDAVYWLMLGPEMLRALADDAEQLAPAEREKLRALVFTRKPRGSSAPPKKAKRRREANDAGIRPK